MRLYSLGGRLSAVADYIPVGARIADIGTDHCRLPIWLLKTGRITKAIATDIRPQPLDRAAENCGRWEVRDCVELRLSDGLEAVNPDECSHIVISGMGGDNIAKILSGAPWTADGGHTLVLQPETSARDLRRFLYMNGYVISDERAVIDGGRVYTVLLAEGGTDTAMEDKFYDYISRPLSLQKDEAARRYFARVHRALRDELNGIDPKSSAFSDKQAVLQRLTRLEGENG